MMNEIVFIHAREPGGYMAMSDDEAVQGIARIYIPEDYDYVRRSIKKRGIALWIPIPEKYRTFDEYVEGTIEKSITHETLHYLIVRLVDANASMGFDFFDTTEEGYRCFE